MPLVILLWCVLAFLALAIASVLLARCPFVSSLVYSAAAIISVIACTAAFIALIGDRTAMLRLPFGLLQQRELTVTGTFRYANTWPAAIALAASGAVDVDALVTNRFSLDQAAQALSSTTAEGTIKSIIEPWR